MSIPISESLVSAAWAFLPDLNGTLYLAFEPDVDPRSLAGTTFDLFYWNGQLLPGDTFYQIQWNLPDGLLWDTTRVYATGQVTLIPEPGTMLLPSRSRRSRNTPRADSRRAARVSRRSRRD